MDGVSLNCWISSTCTSPHCARATDISILAGAPRKYASAYCTFSIMKNGPSPTFCSQCCMASSRSGTTNPSCITGPKRNVIEDSCCSARLSGEAEFFDECRAQAELLDLAARHRPLLHEAHHARHLEAGDFAPAEVDQVF